MNLSHYWKDYSARDTCPNHIPNRVHKHRKIQYMCSAYQITHKAKSLSISSSSPNVTEFIRFEGSKRVQNLCTFALLVRYFRAAVKMEHLPDTHEQEGTQLLSAVQAGKDELWRHALPLAFAKAAGWRRTFEVESSRVEVWNRISTSEQSQKSS